MVTMQILIDLANAFKAGDKSCVGPFSDALKEMGYEKVAYLHLDCVICPVGTHERSCTLIAALIGELDKSHPTWNRTEEMQLYVDRLTYQNKPVPKGLLWEVINARCDW